MFFQNNRRVKEDLEKIRRSNLGDGELSETNKSELKERNKVKERLKELTFKDYLAMVIAVFSIIIPYFLILIGILALIVLFLYLFYLR